MDYLEKSLSDKSAEYRKAIKAVDDKKDELAALEKVIQNTKLEALRALGN